MHNNTGQPEDPDRLLIREIADGNAQALDTLYAQYGPAVLNFLTARLSDREKAEEVLQDVMLAVWKGAANFRGDSRVLTWLLTIARNRAINVYRKRQIDTVEFEDELDMRGSDTGPLEKVMRRDRDEALREAVNLLNPHHREVLTLVFFHQLSGVEVADVLGISEGTVKSRLHRAKETLRRMLHGEEIL